MFLAGTNSLGRYVIQPKTLFKVNRYKLAYQATTNLVSDYLIHPAKAQFCSFDEMNITDGYKQFFVSGTVDGDDEHGTFLRNKFDLLLDSDGEGYKLTVHLLEFSPASN